MKFIHKGVGPFLGEVVEIILPATYMIELWERVEYGKIINEGAGTIVKVPFTELENWKDILKQLKESTLDHPTVFH